MRARILGIAASLVASFPLLAAGAEAPQQGPRPPAAPAPPSYSLSAASTAPDEVVPLPPDLEEGWYARIDTSMGPFVARLLPDQAPQSVAHFAALAEGRLGWPDPVSGELRREPYYDGQRVTRALAAQFVEMGERTDVARGTPPYFIAPEGEGPVNFSAPGRLGMIRSVMNRISGVKFIATAGTMTSLNYLSPCFGVVVSGLDVVQRMSEVKTQPSGLPLEPITVKKIRIRKVGNPRPLPDPVPYAPKAVPLAPRPR